VEGEDDGELYYEWIVGMPIYPVGYTNFCDGLHIDASGRFWLFCEDVILLGNNTEEALNHLYDPELNWSQNLLQLNVRENIGEQTGKLIQRIAQAEGDLTMTLNGLRRL
jgi:hypothetical protein